MIDVHCHFLPGIDDGPETLEQSLELARIAVDDGIKKSVVTPHIHVGRYDNDRASIRRHVHAFRMALGRHDIPLDIDFAAEVRIDPEIMPMIEDGRVPYLGRVDGYDILLLEFPHSHIPLGSDKLVDWLLARRIRPMIAHPERNRDVMRDFERITPFIEQGCLLQVTAQSVAHGFGDKAYERAVQLLERDWVTLLGSDAHNARFRPPVLSAGRAAAAEIIGEVAAWQLVSGLQTRGQGA